MHLSRRLPLSSNREISGWVEGLRDQLSDAPFLAPSLVLALNSSWLIWASAADS